MVVPAAVTIAFSLITEFVTLTTFPNAEDLALEVGVKLRYAMASVLFMVTIDMLFARNLEVIIDQRCILLGTLL